MSCCHIRTFSVYKFLKSDSDCRYVIDPGFVKQRQYNPSTGMYSLDVVQISKYGFQISILDASLSWS